MNRSLLILFSCVLLAAISPAQTETPKESPTQSVQGKVVDAKTGQPIRKVNVGLMGGAEGQQSFAPHSAITAADGSFTFTDIPPGKYIVTLQHPGFIQATGRGPFFFTLSPRQSLTGLLFQMQAAGIISGKITDHDGDPMAAGSVSVESIGASHNPPSMMRPPGFGLTNDLGEYRIAGLRPGKYLVMAKPSQPPPAAHSSEREAQKDNLIYGSTYYPGTLDKSRAIPVIVQSSEEATANFGPLTTHAYRVTGTVSGAPSAALTQLVLYSTSGSDSADAPQQLGEGGRFEVQNLLPGTYTAMLMVVKGLLGGDQPQIQLLRLTPSIDVDNANVDGLQLHVEPGGQLRGKFHLDTEDKFDWTQLNVNLLPVPDDPSAAPTGVMRAMAPFPSEAGSSSAVSADGTFELKNVPSGNYQLLIGASSNNLRDYYTKSVSLAGRDVADSGFVMNGDVYLDVVVSAKGATIDGNVVDSKGQPAPYATVVVVPDSGHRARPDSYQQSTADEHGHFSIPGLNPASYLVLAFEELQLDTHNPEFSKSHRDQAEKVELKEGARVTVTAKIVPAETQTP